MADEPAQIEQQTENHPKNSRTKKIIIILLLIIFLILLLMVLSGDVTGMITGLPGTTTTVETTSPPISTITNIINIGNNETTSVSSILTNTTTTATGGGGGGSPSTVQTTVHATVPTSIFTTTTTIFQIDNDTMGIGNYTGKVNDTIDVDVWLSSSKGAYAAQFNLAFNSSLLRLTSVINGSFFSYNGKEVYWFNYTFNNNILYAETRINTTEDRIGKDVLARISFLAVSAGQSVLGLHNVSVVNSSEQYVNITVHDGFILVS